MSQTYKVIKLRSGEELIAEVSDSSDGKMTLTQPMVFKTIVIPDPNGYPKEGTILKNWLAFGNNDSTTIPLDFVATILEPTTDVVNHYLLEKEKQKIQYESKPIEDFAKPKKKNLDIAEYEEKLSEMFDSIFKDLEEEKVKSSKPKEEEDLPPKDHIIHMNMIFSPQVLAHMINEGLIDPRDIMDMIRHFGLDEKKTKRRKKKNNRESINDKKYTGEQKDRNDFGNKWTDWNPDPNSDEYK
jgi:hypothetical protein